MTPADKPPKKKTPAKKAPAKKTPAKKPPAKKAPAKKVPAKKVPANWATSKKGSGPYSMRPPEPRPLEEWRLLRRSKVKEALKVLGKRTSPEFITALNDKVHALLKEAAGRATKARRVTVRAEDLENGNQEPSRPSRGVTEHLTPRAVRSHSDTEPGLL